MSPVQEETELGAECGGGRDFEEVGEGKKKRWREQTRGNVDTDWSGKEGTRRTKGAGVLASIGQGRVADVQLPNGDGGGGEHRLKELKEGEEGKGVQKSKNRLFIV